MDPHRPNEIVSCGFGVILSRIPSFWNISGRCGFCQWFYTAPEYRGQKLGDQIMRIVMDWFVKQGITRVTLNATHKAMPFYKRFGFELAVGWPQMEWKKPDSNSI
jgi:GNAT superfamily N-acetyltransferase